jgi:hypothetical protein
MPHASCLMPLGAWYSKLMAQILIFGRKSHFRDVIGEFEKLHKCVFVLLETGSTVVRSNGTSCATTGRTGTTQYASTGMDENR